MIDTIKVEIPLNIEIIAKLKKVGDRTAKLRYFSDGSHITIYDNNLIRLPIVIRREANNPSSMHEIAMYVGKNYIRMEFSVPKLIYGHNLVEVGLDEVLEALQKLSDYIESRFDLILPPPTVWGVLRLDLCRITKYQDQENLERVLQGIKSLNYKRFKKHIYQTSVMWTGDECSMKYYLKYPEFLRNDGKYFIGDENLTELARNVLRFEMTMRSGMLKRLFGSNIRLGDLESSKLIYYLDKYKEHLEMVKPYIVAVSQVKKLLLAKYSKTRTAQLYQFFRLYYYGQETDRQLMKELYSRQQIYSNLRALKEADICFVPDSESTDAESEVSISPSKTRPFSEL